MGEYFEQMWNGPGHLRFILQPLVALLLGIRDGIRDSKEGRGPYLLGLITNRQHEPHRFRKLIKQLTVPLIVAIVMDLIFQLMIRSYYRPRASIGFAILFIAFPYCAARGLSNRVSTHFRKHRKEPPRRRLEA